MLVKPTRYGTFLFNNLVRPPPCLPIPAAVTYDEPTGEEEDGLLIRTSIDGIDGTATLPADLGTSGYDVVPAGERVAPAASG